MTNNPLEFVDKIPPGSLWGVVVGGALVSAGSLAWGVWSELQARKVEGKMVRKTQDRLYAIEEIRGSIGRMIKSTIEDLNIDEETAEEICRALAFKLGRWELHPPPKPPKAPDPVYVKQQIIERLNNGVYAVRARLPDVKSSTRQRVETLFLSLGRRK